MKIIRTVNALNAIEETEATIAAAKALDSVVTEYKHILATAHGRKTSGGDTPDPSPDPETASEASKTAS